MWCPLANANKTGDYDGNSITEGAHKTWENVGLEHRITTSDVGWRMGV